MESVGKGALAADAGTVATNAAARGAAGLGTRGLRTASGRCTVVRIGEGAAGGDIGSKLVHRTASCAGTDTSSRAFSNARSHPPWIATPMATTTALPDDRQPQTGAGNIVPGTAPEPFEHMLARRRRYPRAVVGDDQAQVPAVHLQRDMDAPTGPSVAQGVVDEVVQHRLECRSIERDDQPIKRIQRQLRAARHRLRYRPGEHSLHQVGDVDRLQFARIDFVERRQLQQLSTQVRGARKRVIQRRLGAATLSRIRRSREHVGLGRLVGWVAYADHPVFAVHMHDGERSGSLRGDFVHGGEMTVLPFAPLLDWPYLLRDYTYFVHELMSDSTWSDDTVRDLTFADDPAQPQDTVAAEVSR